MRKIVILILVLFALPYTKNDSWAVEEIVKSTPITTTEAVLQQVLVTEEAIGWIETRTSPTIAAEVPGQVIKVFVDYGQSVQAGEPLAELDAEERRLAVEAQQSEVDRLKALIVNQERTVKRLRSLLDKKSVPQDRVDNAEAQLISLNEQLSGATARLSDKKRLLSECIISSPVAGRVEERYIAEGDYLKVGNPLFKIITDRRLRVVLPFPENVAFRLRLGLAVQLSSPLTPGMKLDSTITEIRPSVNTKNRAIEVIVDIENPGTWKPGASVNGTVIIAQKSNTVMVPDQSVVRRPAGEVVYIIEEDIARQREVKSGLRVGELLEIENGLNGGETIAVDGAGYLTDNAPVQVRGKK